MNEDRFLKRLAVVTLIFLAGVVTIGLLATPERGSGNLRQPAAASTSYPHDVLQQDAWMTQQMSTAEAPVMSNETQLQRSQHPGYVRAVEQHQADIERMLAE